VRFLVQEGVNWRVALLIQFYLLQYNIDAAEKQLVAAKSWAQDNLLIQLAEVEVICDETDDSRGSP